MRKSLMFVMLAGVSLWAHGSEPCREQAPRNLDADLSGVRAVEIQLGGHNLHLTGVQGGHALEVRGRACASSTKLLDRVHLSQHRDGDRLVLVAESDSNWSFGLFNDRYAYLDLKVRMPNDLPLTLVTGSGDAEVSDVASLDGHVGSGDLHARRVKGNMRMRVGSGDVDATEVGALDIGSIGSGDFKADRVGGEVRVGSVGSGDLTLLGVRGGVQVDSIGSGDLRMRDIGGNVEVGSVGSGDVEADGIDGDLTVRSTGSGDVDYRHVRGSVNVPHDDD